MEWSKEKANTTIIGAKIKSYSRAWYDPCEMKLQADAISAFAACVSAVATCVALFIYRAQSREMRIQTKQLAKSVEAGNLLRLIVDVIDKEHMREGRKRIALLGVRSELLAHWTEVDLKHGEDVIRSFDLMGLMVRRSLLDKQLVLTVWGVRILQMHRATRELRARLRMENDPGYMANFDWLASQAEALENEHRQAPAIN